MSTFARNLHIAGLLQKGATYAQISAYTGASKSTVAEVKRASQAGDQIAPAGFQPSPLLRSLCAGQFPPALTDLAKKKVVAA